MNLKTIAGWAVLAFVVWWTIQQPHNAADIVHHISDFLATAATGLSHFVASV